MDDILKLQKKLDDLERRLKRMEGRLAPPPKNMSRKDVLYDDANHQILEFKNPSAGFLQRRLSIGYARAVRILDELEADGIVGPAAGDETRKILVET